MKKNVVFVTGTRADYGKMKPLMKALDADDNFEMYVFVCGMHLSESLGSTYEEIQRDGYKNIYIAFGIAHTNDSSVNLGNTVTCFAGYVSNIKPNMIVVHGDRMDALAGAIVGAQKNIPVAHIEGGELSGTLDESIRHAISKFAHIHFVCTEEAKRRLIQLGEEENRIYVIGSPDIDIMLSDTLPDLSKVKDKYEIGFDKYAILMYHPVTTEFDRIGNNIESVVNAVMESDRNYVVVYPNDDLGSQVIIREYSRIRNNPHFRVFPSIRFEYFLTLLKNAEFIIGNSSAGIREAGIYGLPAIDIGSRQNCRYNTQSEKNIQHVVEDVEQIKKAIECVDKYRYSSAVFGKGNSTDLFLNIIRDEEFWNVHIQKRFVDLDL